MCSLSPHSTAVAHFHWCICAAAPCTCLVVWRGALQLHDGVISGRLCKGGIQRAVLGHLVELVLLADIADSKRLILDAKRCVSHLHWQVVVQVQKAYLREQVVYCKLFVDISDEINRAISV